VLVPWHDLVVGSPAAADFVKRYPYLKKYVEDGTPGTTVSIAESSRGTVRGDEFVHDNPLQVLNLLFVIRQDPLYCGSGGCAFTIYQDNGHGHGYVSIADLLGDEVPIRIFRGLTLSPDGSQSQLSVFMPYQHHQLHRPDWRAAHRRRAMRICRGSLRDAKMMPLRGRALTQCRAARSPAAG